MRHSARPRERHGGRILFLLALGALIVLAGVGLAQAQPAAVPAALGAGVIAHRLPPA